jgi:hypothetical protein
METVTEIDLEKYLFEKLNSRERLFENQLFDAITKLHPTLQQTWFRVMKNFIYRYADIPDNHFDARNEASHEWAKRAAGESDGRPNFIALPTI